MKNLIKIENRCFSDNYFYCESNGCIYESTNTNIPLFDFYTTFQSLPIEMIIAICQNILMAYQKGIRTSKKEILNKFIESFDLN